MVRSETRDRPASLPRLGLVVPSLDDGGGVPAVARFLAATATRSGKFALSIISLSTSARDEASLRLASPRSWIRGAVIRRGIWNGHPFVHVGAVLGELEFMRYRPRTVLAQAIENCDVLQVVCGSPAWANTVIGCGKPVSIQCATRAIVERRAKEGSPKSIADYWRKSMTRITDRLDNRALCKGDAIQVENRWMLDYVSGVNSARDVDVRYAPPGIDENLFHPLPMRDLTDSPYILCVGRLGDPRKNIVLLLRSYSRLEPSLRDRVRLVLAGSSQPPAAFWRLADELGLRHRIEFVHRPSREALVALYQSAAVFALPSDEEGLGVVLLEAMACGVPVVSTRSGGPDGIVEDGVDGYLVAIDDDVALAGRLTLLLQDAKLNSAAGRAARQTIEQRYTEAATGRVFVDIWSRLLQGPVR